MSGGWQSQSDREREEELPGLQLQWPKTVELPPIHIIQTTIRDIPIQRKVKRLHMGRGLGSIRK